MSSMYDDVKKFHEKFELKQRETGHLPDHKLINLRLSFLIEELHELTAALAENDLEQATDALVDLVYVTLGTAYLLNLPFDGAWDSVHAANMQKVRVPGEIGGVKLNIKKPPGWKHPDHFPLFSNSDQQMLWHESKQLDDRQLDLEEFIKKSSGA